MHSLDSRINVGLPQGSSAGRVLTDISIQTASQTVGMLVVGRIISGICVGITSTLVPVYQSELAPKEVRGRMVSLQQWAITWVCFPKLFGLPIYLTLH